MHESGRACARSDQRRVRRSTASKMSDSSAESSRGDAVGPCPDIVKQVVFKIEKLTKRVHRPKAPAALPQPKMCHLLCAAWRALAPAAACRHRPQRARQPARVNATNYLPHIANKHPTSSNFATKNSIQAAHCKGIYWGWTTFQNLFVFVFYEAELFW